MTEISAILTYKNGEERWTRGREHWMSHSEFGDYLYRNADRIERVDSLEIVEVK